MMFLGEKFCSHCGARADRAELGESTTRRCPRCRAAMTEINLANTSVLECSRCEGIWADKISLEQICADRERQAAVLGMPTQMTTDLTGQVENNIRYVPCPVCAKLMNRVNFARCSHVVVDVCREHGTWFDKDELRRIVEFIRAGGIDLARAKEMAALEEQRRSLKAAQAVAALSGRSRDERETTPSLLGVLFG
jgi:Zn-finger nucleic acid-binding protein